MASELGVQTIQHTNGTDALTIESDGRMVRDQVPRLLALRDPSVDVTALTQIDGWRTPEFAVGISESSGTFTLAKGGLYQISYHFIHQGNSGGVYFYHNGTRIFRSSYCEIVTSWATQNASFIYEFEDGDTFDLRPQYNITDLYGDSGNATVGSISVLWVG